MNKQINGGIMLTTKSSSQKSTKILFLVFIILYDCLKLMIQYYDYKYKQQM